MRAPFRHLISFLLLLLLTCQDASDLGKLPQLQTFLGSRMTVRRADGALMTLSVPVYPILLYELVRKMGG